MEPLEFSFTITPDDYARSIRSFTLRNPTHLIGMGAIALLVTLLLCFILTTGVLGFRAGGPFSSPVAWATLLMFPCVVGVVPVQLLVIRPAIIARQVRKHEDKVGLVTWKISDKYVEIESPQARTEMAWSNFQKVVDAREYYLVIYAINKNMFQIVPHQSFENSQDEARFRQFVEKHIGPIK